MSTKCVKCGTALHGKNAQDMGICLECYNIEQSADFEEEPEGLRRPVKTNSQMNELANSDKQRIAKKAVDLYELWNNDKRLMIDRLFEMGEYATRYEREKQRELREENEALKIMVKEKYDYMTKSLNNKP